MRTALVYLFTRARKATVDGVKTTAALVVAGVMSNGLTEAELAAAVTAGIAAWYVTWRTPNTPAGLF